MELNHIKIYKSFNISRSESNQYLLHRVMYANMTLCIPSSFHFPYFYRLRIPRYALHVEV